MELDKNPIEELANNELLLNRLYLAYGNNLVDMKGFWDEIAADERRHYAMVMELLKKEVSGEIFVHEDRFDIKAIQAFGDDMMKRINEAESAKPDAIKSLTVAVQAERNLLERNIFEVFESDDFTLQDILGALKGETEEHLKTVEDKLKKYTK